MLPTGGLTPGMGMLMTAAHRRSLGTTCWVMWQARERPMPLNQQQEHQSATAVNPTLQGMPVQTAGCLQLQFAKQTTRVIW